MAKILFAAGGSIGHIAPCVAVWRAAQMLDRRAQTHFICSTRKEDLIFLQTEGAAFTALCGRRVTTWSLPMMILRAWKILGRVKPDVIFSKGGGVTVPVALAGRAMGIPLVIHESDAVPGRATRLLSRFAERVCRGFPGNPVRPELFSGSREKGFVITGLSGSRPVLLVMGGSQGASALNDAITAQLDAILSLVDVVHITGAGKSGAAPRTGRYWTREFAHEDYPHLLAIADMALSRAGAGAISEFAALGIVPMLVPLRGLAHDHQEKNARAAEEKGACVVIEQDALGSALLRAIVRFGTDANFFSEIRRNICALADLDAGKKTADILLAVAHEYGGVP
ncbi:glycosyltransferase [Candidatus Peregrinibacteria bacterium]|nr:glycosyltransferase [Candidatus Peregrinibacteria bacterium]